MEFVVKKVSNTVFIVTNDCHTIFKTWHESDFTERKMRNAINKITKQLNGNATFEILV